MEVAIAAPCAEPNPGRNPTSKDAIKPIPIDFGRFKSLIFSLLISCFETFILSFQLNKIELKPNNPLNIGSKTSLILGTLNVKIPKIPLIIKITKAQVLNFSL